MQRFSSLLLVWILTFACIFRSSEACECGRSSSSRIYDGYNAASNDYPWMVKLYSVFGNKLTQCGASMISPLYAVTAGHCAPESTSARSYIVFGSRSIYDVIYSSPNVEKFTVKARGDRGKDIALVKLKRSVNVVPICLPPTDKSFAGVTATMLGYGETESGDTSRKMLAGDIVVPSNNQCNRVQRVYSTELCGGNYGGGPAFCSGDSGGPLMYLDKTVNRWILIGIVSASYKCSDTNTYGLFTRVTSWVSWIQQNSNNAGCQVRTK